MTTEIRKRLDGYSNRAFEVDKFHRRFLISYYTIVGYVNTKGNFHRTWGGYSKTTVDKHVKRFGFSFSKKEWESLPVEKLPKITIKGKSIRLYEWDIVSDSEINRNLKLMTDIARYYPRYSYGF